MEQEIKRRFAYRIGDKLPKPFRVIYYLLLSLTLIYWLYRVITGVLEMIQRLGAFIFEKRNFYTFIVCLLILGVGVLLASQYVFGLDPFGKIVAWALEKWEAFRLWCIELIGG